MHHTHRHSVHCPTCPTYNVAHIYVQGDNRTMQFHNWRTDSYGHGTQMAGVIAAVPGNNRGIAGINSLETPLHLVAVFAKGDESVRFSELVMAYSR